jgi:hypothetical protein
LWEYEAANCRNDAESRLSIKPLFVASEYCANGVSGPAPQLRNVRGRDICLISKHSAVAGRLAARHESSCPWDTFRLARIACALIVAHVELR